MSDTVEITTLGNGLRVISEHMPRLQTASLGVWVDVGTRYEPAEVNGVAHLLEHMAFKGTARRSARAIAEEIERVGGSLNAYTSREHTAYYARILADDVGACRRHPGRHPAQLVLRPGRAGEGASRRPAGDRPGQGHARRPRLRPAAGGVLPRPADGPSHPRPGGDRPGHAARGPDRLHGAPLRPQAPGLRRRRQDRARPAGRPRPAPVRRSGGNRACRRPSRPATAAARRSSSARTSSRCICAWPSRACPTTIPTISRCRCCRPRWAAACPRACSRRRARTAACATRSSPSPRPMPTPASSASMPAPTPRTCPS